MSTPAARRDRVASELAKLGLDALVVSNPANVSYLTGFSGDSSYLLLRRHKSVLLSDGRFTEQIREECPDLEAVIRKTTGVKMTSVIAKVCRRARIGTIGIEASTMTVAESAELQAAMPRVQTRGVTGVVEGLRARKDAREIAKIRESIGIAERAFRRFRADLAGLATEKEAADHLEWLMRREGAERGSFDTIVAVGAHGAQGHARPDDRRLMPGQPIVVDWGASGRFYKSDLTRVLCLRTIPAKLEAVYKVVLRAQERAIQRIRPGIRGHDVDAEARATIEKSGFGRFFTHGTGHGIGLQVHESPAMRPNSDAILTPGMVVTVEPGIYIRGWGGVRIEDDVLVTRTGHQVLSSLPKTLDSVLVP